MKSLLRDRAMPPPERIPWAAQLNKPTKGRSTQRPADQARGLPWADFVSFYKPQTAVAKWRTAGCTCLTSPACRPDGSPDLADAAHPNCPPGQPVLTRSNAPSIGNHHAKRRQIDAGLLPENLVWTGP